MTNPGPWKFSQLIISFILLFVCSKIGYNNFFTTYKSHLLQLLKSFFFWERNKFRVRFWAFYKGFCQKVEISTSKIHHNVSPAKWYIFRTFLIHSNTHYSIGHHRWARVLGQGGCVHTGCVRKKILRPPLTAVTHGCEFLGIFSPWGEWVCTGVWILEKF